jgi:hypothetical protein
MKNTFCPVIIEAEIVLQKTNDLSKAVQSLRRSLKKCRLCKYNQDCPLIHQISSSIDAALDEIIIEFGISNDG